MGTTKRPIALIVYLSFCLVPYSCEKEGEIVTNPVASKFSIVPYITFEQWGNRQGGAIYGDFLVSFDAADHGMKPNGHIYDVNTGKKICDITLGSTLEGKQYHIPHANQVSFSSEFYDGQSEFPLLYVSQVNGGNGEKDIRGERGVLVYNLRKLGEGKYEPEMVQAIIPDLEDDELMQKLGNYTPNYVVDNDKHQFVIIGYPNDSWFRLSGSQPVAIVDMPPIGQKEVVLRNSDIVDSYSLPVSLAPQQSFCYNGKVYSSCGIPKQASLRIINLEGKSVEYYRDMTDITKGEPQFLGLWKGKLLYYEFDKSGLMYEMKVPGYRFE